MVQNLLNSNFIYIIIFTVNRLFTGSLCYIKIVEKYKSVKVERTTNGNTSVVSFTSISVNPFGQYRELNKNKVKCNPIENCHSA